MNKKSIRSRTTKPVQKSLPAAVHAAALSLESEIVAAAPEPLVVDGLHVPSDHVADPVAATATDTPPADAAASRAKKPVKADKAEKPAKPVKFSFSLPASEARLFDELRAADGAKIKKSILLRAALLALAEIDKERLAQIVGELQPPVAVKVPKAAPKAKSKK